MYVVKADNPDVGFRITPPIVKDSEGNNINAAALNFEITSDNPDAVSIEVNPDDPLSGTTHFGKPQEDGTPSLANINVLVKNSDNTVLGSFGAQFTVVAGDPASIVGGSIAFDTLSETAPVES